MLVMDTDQSLVLSNFFQTSCVASVGNRGMMFPVLLPETALRNTSKRTCSCHQKLCLNVRRLSHVDNSNQQSFFYLTFDTAGKFHSRCFL